MPDYKGKTNEVKEVKLESSIDRVVWTAGSVTAGGKVGLAIDTHFVGNGSELKIQLKDGAGKSHGNFSEKIGGNSFWVEITVPEAAKDSLVAKVKLPKHNLEMDSNPLIVYPAIKLKNLKWDKSEARRGDILTMTADIETVPDGTEAEVEIWEYDDDQAHDFITKIPVEVKGKKIECKWEFEYHEDTDDIPTKEETEKGYNPPEYFFRVKVLGVSADSEILKFKDWFEIVLVSQSGEPIPDEKYKLILPDGSSREGKLDKEGKAVEKDIPPGICKVEFPEL